MRRVPFDPSQLTGDRKAWWDAWQQRADDATVKAISAWEKGEEVTFSTAVWGDLKEWLLDNVFHEKCAYCETRAPRFPGHAEHYRPKGRVDVKDPGTGKSVAVKVEWPNGTIETHPGYFWLAYHWKNLLPACHACNSGRGKQNQFPLDAAHQHALVPRLTAAQAQKLAATARASVKWPGRYYLDPDALDALENPQILNPYFEDPREHLRFGAGGVVIALGGSAKGQHSIAVYQLDDASLERDRQRQQTKAEMIFRTRLVEVVIAKTPGNILDQAYAALGAFERGEEEYSAAALDFVQIVKQDMETRAGAGS